MITYPASYTSVGDEELVYIDGGFDFENFSVISAASKLYHGVLSVYDTVNSSRVKKVFDWAFGNYLRDSVVLTDFRAALWKSMKTGNTKAFTTLEGEVESYPVIGRVAYAYGILRVGETFISYLR